MSYVRDIMSQSGIKTVLLLNIVIVLAIMGICHRYGSLLDGLNATIATQTEFKTFHAGATERKATHDLYPELKVLETNFDELQDEVRKLVKIAKKVPCMRDTYNEMFMRTNDPRQRRDRWYHGITHQLWRVIYGDHLDIFNKIQTDKWRTLNLIVYNNVVWENANLCPKLLQTLMRMKCVQTALLSFMLPGANVPPHSDPATGVLRYHMAFIVPKEREKCFMILNGNRYVWSEGESLVFDTVYEHSVINESDECRVVLFLDLYRPLRNPAKLLQSVADNINRVSPGTFAVIRGSGLLQSP